MVSKSADPLTRDRGFESGSLQRGVMCEPVFFKTVAQFARELFRWFKKERCGRPKVRPLNGHLSQI